MSMTRQHRNSNYNKYTYTKLLMLGHVLNTA